VFIYKITNHINSKVYIGQTSRKIEERWRNHCRKNHTTTAINSAIKKYGKENFTIEILFCVLQSEHLDTAERFFIKYYNCLAPNGYNLDSGGNCLKRLSLETRKKLSEAKLGKKYGPRHSETGDNIALGRCGKYFCVFEKNSGLFVGKWVNKCKCARELNLNSSHIGACLKLKRKSHKGYIFKYLEETHNVHNS